MPESPPNVVFILLDTVRADHLSCYGYPRQTTPAIDRLAQRGVLFRRAQSMAPWTIPSIASLWTGVQPTVHGAGIPARIKRFVNESSFRGFDEKSFVSLPQRLAQRGYENFAVIANSLLGLECYTDGFAKEHCQVKRVPAADVVDKALSWLPAMKAAGGPFFLYLHFMDAHQPLDPPQSYRDLFPTDGGDRSSGRFKEWGGFGQPQRLSEAEFPAFKATKLAVYDGALRYLDDQIDRLLTKLEGEGLLANTAIIVTADHGEEFWDHVDLQRDLYNMTLRPHFGIGHGHTQFQELLGVPLVFTAPWLPPREVSSWVSMPDLSATLLAYASQEPELELGQAKSLIPLMAGRPEVTHVVMSEETEFGFEIKTLVDDSGLKFIAAIDPSEKHALFDLVNDPGETRNLVLERPEVVARMEGLLKDRLAWARARRRNPGQSGRVDASELEKIGYIAPAGK